MEQVVFLASGSQKQHKHPQYSQLIGQRGSHTALVQHVMRRKNKAQSNFHQQRCDGRGGRDAVSISINLDHTKRCKKHCNIHILFNFEKDSFIPVLYAISAKYFGLESNKKKRKGSSTFFKPKTPLVEREMEWFVTPSL